MILTVLVWVLRKDTLTVDGCFRHGDAFARHGILWLRGPFMKLCAVIVLVTLTFGCVVPTPYVGRTDDFSSTKRALGFKDTTGAGTLLLLLVFLLAVSAIIGAGALCGSLTDTDAEETSNNKQDSLLDAIFSPDPRSEYRR